MEEEKKNEVNAEVQSADETEKGGEKPQEPFKRMSANVGILGCGVILAIGCFIGKQFPSCKLEVALIIILSLATIWMLYSEGAFSKKVPWNKRKRMLIVGPILMIGVGLWRYYALTGRGDVWQSKLGLCIAIAVLIWDFFVKEN